MGMDSRVIAMFGHPEDATLFYKYASSRDNWWDSAQTHEIVITTVSGHSGIDIPEYLRTQKWRYPDEVIAVIKDEDWPWRVLYVADGSQRACLMGMKTLASLYDG